MYCDIDKERSEGGGRKTEGREEEAETHGDTERGSVNEGKVSNLRKRLTVSFFTLRPSIT